MITGAYMIKRLLTDKFETNHLEGNSSREERIIYLPRYDQYLTLQTQRFSQRPCPQRHFRKLSKTGKVMVRQRMIPEKGHLLLPSSR